MLPKINKILYATDLSTTAEVAMSWAMSLAEQYDAAVTIIHVMPDLVEEMSGSMGYDLGSHFGAEQLALFNKEGQSKAMESVRERIKSVSRKMRDELPSCRVDLNHIIIKTGHEGNLFSPCIHFKIISDHFSAICPKWRMEYFNNLFVK